MRTRRHQAEQFEFALPVRSEAQKPRRLPPAGSVLRIWRSRGSANGLWRVKSAMVHPGGIFLGLEGPLVSKRKTAARPAIQEELEFSLCGPIDF